MIRTGTWLRWLAISLLLPFAALPAQGQTANGIVTIETERLFADSAYGKRIETDLEAVRAALIAENRTLDETLSREEVEMVALRDTLSAEEFAARAEAFDEKVQTIREAQETKSRDLTQRREAERQAFLTQVLPVVARISSERGALAVLERRTVLLAADSIDITDAVIAEMDATLGDGSAIPAPELPPEPDGDTPAPEPAPEP